MQSINKKALSTVIATLLIIVLSMIAITITWTAVRNLISEETLLAPESCLESQINSPYSLGKACYNETGKELIIELNKKFGNYEIIDAFFIVNEITETSRWCCGKDCPNCKLPETGLKTYYLSPIEQKPTSVTLNINNCVLQTNPVVNC
jgi:hypothetical protein